MNPQCAAEPQRPKTRLLFTTPRSGSWPVYHLLRELFEHQEGLTGLGEFFSLGGPSYELRNGQILSLSTTKQTVPAEVFRLQETDILETLGPLIITKRHEMLRTTTHAYFLKLFPHQIGSGPLPFLARECEWIFLERRDLFSQLLSYMISRLTHLYYQPNGIDLKDCKLVAQPGIFKSFEREVWGYYFTKLALKPKQVLYFEDFVRLNSADFLGTIGLFWPPGLPRQVETQRQNLGDKTKLFENLSELRDWYAQSYLDRISPLAGAKI